ncbi:MAG: class I SAM-dependent methyltransferase, partial [Candidatus Rokuibacteriota bacterium]
RLGVTVQSSGGLAVDLGCGSGFQSIALARLGFRVLAVDFCQRLLDELTDRTPGLAIEAIAGDIRDVAQLVPASVALVVCMGDTLAHLEREADLDRVFRGVAGRLVAGGRLVLSFRDLSDALRDLDRVIPLGAWDDLVMTCFLEYEASTVKVHDLIWVRELDGWRFRKGVYRKLRLAPARVIARLRAAGFAVERHDAPGGMVALVGVLVGQHPGRQRRHGRMSSGRGNTSGGAKTARYPSAGVRTKKSTSR